MPKDTGSSAGLDFVLRVVHAFDDYRRGDEIKDEETINKILNSDHASYVVKANKPKLRGE